MTSRSTSLRSAIVLLWVALLTACSGDDRLVPPTVVRPPFDGTIFIDPDIITDADPTTFTGLVYSGQASREMFDRRVDTWVTLEPFLFDATFSDGLTIEVQVNPEFGSIALAENEAVFYADAVGQLPTALRLDVETMWIHKGVELYGGGNRNILIHTGQSAEYIGRGILEETLVHEAAHSSLDGRYASSPGWIAAQSSDPTFISTYARDFPNREDIAESFGPYLAVRYRSDRISESLRVRIEEAIPNRIAFFDSLALDLSPI
ncbi:MAG: hypothetical protein ACPGPI_08230, partial [Longimicrobiales bacterium]